MNFSLLQTSLYVVGVTLQVLVLAALIRGAYRTYPFVFGYVLTLLLSTVIDLATIMDSGGYNRSNDRTFWSLYAFRSFLLLVAVFSFIDLALARSAKRRIARVVLSAGALIIAAFSYLIHRDPEHFTRWMTGFQRDVYLCAVILNLVLWMILLAAREKDRTLLMVTGALGLQFTGETIGHSLRQFYQIWTGFVPLGNFFLVAPHFLCLYVWWRAFRKAEVPAVPPLAPSRIP